MSVIRSSCLPRASVISRRALVVFAVGSIFTAGAAMAGADDAEILERIKPVGQVNVAGGKAKAEMAAAPKAAPATAPAAAPAAPVATPAAPVATAPAAPAGDPKALAQSKGCLGCHQIEMKIVGPAYKDVAAKYKGDAAALDHLAAKVQSGGVGTWGQIPMPPNNITDDEAKQLVSWILSL